MNITEVMEVARRHVNERAADTSERISMKSSAEICLEDAETMYRLGRYEFARDRAATAIKYMVGVFHSDYKAVIGEDK